MARRSRRRRGNQNERKRLRGNAAVWLATLSTVVGVATGMFTLRDQVFPREAGTAEAVPVSAYRQQVGRVCDDVNENDLRRARDDKVVSRRVTAAAWNRNLARMRDYAAALDRAGSRRRLDAAIEDLSTLRPALARDGDRIRSGLGRLGAADCDLEPPIVVRTFTLPKLAGEVQVQGESSTNTPGDAAPEPEPEAETESESPGANTPSPSAPAPRDDEPEPPANVGPITGGGED